ncbi:hypothetical protein HC931_04385 [Candidatus Gracilibacteria bacterium]|nr:hypothetical protein [Candidatus Gracilibacteria bacterium]
MNSFPNLMNRLRSQKNYLLQESSNYWRFYKQVVVRPTEIINQKEILIAGLRRTGNHAIIGWIRAQHPDKAWHLNHPPAGQNPYQFLYSHFKKPEFREEAIGNFSKKKPATHQLGRSETGKDRLGKIGKVPRYICWGFS